MSEITTMLATLLFQSGFRHQPATLLIQLVLGQEPLLLVRRCLWCCLYLYISLTVLSPWRTDTDRHRPTLIHSDYSILLYLVNQYHSTPIIHMPLQLSIRQG
jgi:hypothetical protein